MPTGPVFAAWDQVDRGALGTGDPLTAAVAGRNDLEAAAIAICPPVGDLIGWLQQQPGVLLARMSGSGATCFALFRSEVHRDAADTAARHTWPGAWRLATALA